METDLPILRAMRDQQAAEEIARAEQAWQILKDNGVITGRDAHDLQTAKLMAADCLRWTGYVAAVYTQVTGGAIVDPFANPEAVIGAYRRHLLAQLSVASKREQ
jgi:hypothetical protein